MRVRNLLVGLVAVLLLPGTASAIPFTSMYVFGDSLSDNGNLYAATGGLIPPYPYYQGRFSNGPVAAELLANQRIAGGASGPNFHDYAYGGATTGVGNVWDGGTPTTAGTGVLTAPFTGTPTVSGQPLPGIATEVADYKTAVGASGADPNGLYMVWGGPDDFLSGGSINVLQSVNNIASAVTTLAGMGAQYILVPNMVDLSKTPRLLGTPLAAGAQLLSNSFDQTLATTIAALNQQLSARVIPFNTAALFNQVLTDPAAYGLTNTTEGYLSCLQANGPAACGDPNQYMFWDDLHPTYTTTKILAAGFARTVPEPGELALMAMGLMVMVALRRRSGLRRADRKAHCATAG